MNHSGSEPFVSVIVPNYNHSRFLEERLQSILNQSYQNYELIVLDDASSDDSVETIQRCLAGRRHQLEVNASNSGSPFLQWAKGIEMATGDLIWIAESDDSARPELLERLVACFEDPSVSLAYCQSIGMTETSASLQTWKAWTDDLSPRLWAEDFCVAGPFFIEHFLAIRNCIPNASAVVFRRDRCSTAVLRSSRLTISTDWLFWTEVVATGRLAFVAEPLNRFRMHQRNVRSRHAERVLAELISVSHQILINDRYCPEDVLRRQHLAASLNRFWSHWNFHLSSPATWRQHRQGVALLLTLLRQRRRLLALLIADALGRLSHLRP